jgi:hypothetical protein
MSILPRNAPEHRTAVHPLSYPEKQFQTNVFWGPVFDIVGVSMAWAGLHFRPIKNGVPKDAAFL